MDLRRPRVYRRSNVGLVVNCDRGRIEIDHLYGLRCRGWYCNPEQHSLCRPARPQAAAQRPAQLVLFRIAVPTTPAQTVSWSIPITRYSVSANEISFDKKISQWDCVFQIRLGLQENDSPLHLVTSSGFLKA